MLDTMQKCHRDFTYTIQMYQNPLYTSDNKIESFLNIRKTLIE